MAYATLQFVNPRTGQRRNAPVGFSWTTLFFGFWPAVFRGHWPLAVLQCLIGMATFGLSILYFMFAYNGMYIRYLVNDGYVVTGDERHIRQVEARSRLSLPRAEEGDRAGYYAQTAPRMRGAIDPTPQGITL